MEMHTQLGVIQVINIIREEVFSQLKRGNRLILDGKRIRLETGQQVICRHGSDDEITAQVIEYFSLNPFHFGRRKAFRRVDLA